MASRLEITHGLIAERDRLSTSGDTLSVTRPNTGSKTRTKGVLVVLVCASVGGPRVREASRLVADTIRQEYYYDESAGVPVCVEKAIRSADRRLRGSREASILPPASLGVGVAVVRNNELYLATLGSAEAYLVRSARLLMPDRSSTPGLPASDAPAVDVWRGEIHVGDALVLVSRNMTETVGTEELKSAALTLHPQAAAEHLHHLFVAAGGEGSDAIITLEATEQTTRATSPSASAADAYGDLPGALPEPATGAVGPSVAGARHALSSSFGDLMDRMWDAMPHRQASAQGLSARTSRAETQRRAAIGALALVGVVLLLGLFVVLVPRGGDTRIREQIAGSDSALAVARDRADRADKLVATDEDQALAYYREAWEEVQRARDTGLSAPALDELEARVQAGLDSQYGARIAETKVIKAFRDVHDPAYLVRGPRGAAYFIDREDQTVNRVAIKDGTNVAVAHEGDKPASGGKARLGEPMQIEASGTEIVIVDDKARAWRWRPSDQTGRGTLAKLTFLGGAQWGDDHGDIETFDDASGYRLYVIEPTQAQILRYQQTFDGSAFQVPTPYLVTKNEGVGDIRQLYIDADLYALTDEALQRYRFGRYEGTFALKDPPDAEDMRPGHDYALVTGTGSAATNGRLYLYDAKHDRIVGFSKESGEYIGQWTTGPKGPSMDDMRGMYVVRAKKKKDPDRLFWVTPEGVFESTLARK
jgi:hypothetical protein